jgi:hypothetical protein
MLGLAAAKASNTPIIEEQKGTQPMKDPMTSPRSLGRMLSVLGFTTLIMLSLWSIMVSTAKADGPVPLSVSGYLDFSYGTTVESGPTAEGVESKLWWHDGFWWASMYNPQVEEWHIHRLNWHTQTWEDTGVLLDDRDGSRADVLWDGNKLYVASHLAVPTGRHTSVDSERGRLYRYSYDEAAQTYSLDSGFPVNVNEDKTESLVVAKDSTGRLWVTYVTQPTLTSDRQVFVNASSGNDLTWGTPFTIPVAASHVDADDLSSVVTFRDDSGYKTGVIWSNQVDNNFYFAVHNDTESGPATGWDVRAITPPDTANDHISIKSLQTASSGQVFAVIKTSAISDTDTLVGVVARDTGGSFSFHEYSTVADRDTRPILLIDEGDLTTTSDDQIHVFVTGTPGGGRICYKSADITTPLSNMSFLSGNCGDSFIQDEDGGIDLIDNSTSTKQNVNETTGLVVLASDDVNGQVYVHNVMGTPPPVVTARGPARDATDVQVSAVVTAAFSSKDPTDMDQSTLTTANFTVEDGSGPIAGTISYDSATRTATFTPDSVLEAETVYTVTLTQNIEDSSGNGLYQGEEWSFTTEPVKVQFSNATYSVNEGAGSASIEVTLNTQSSQEITVPYHTSDGTATTADNDYTAASSSLTFLAGETSHTFDVTINDDGIDEPNETVNLILDPPTNATLGTPGSAILTIVDNDGPATVQFEPTTVQVDEDVASGTATLTVTLNIASGFTIQVDYNATAGGTATLGSDYTLVGGTLTFDPGDTSKTFDVFITNDSLDEPDETVLLELTNPISATLGTPDEIATLTILDDDPPPSVQFSSNTYSVNEADGTATITATLSAASGKSITVDYSINAGTATSGSDFTAGSDTLTFDPGDTSKTFTVPIINDALDEGNETVSLALSGPSNATLGTPHSATLSILDDDPPPSVQFSSSTYSVNEIAGAASITVTLSVVSGQSVSVDYATSDGTATAGDDYVAVLDTVTLPPGVVTKAFTVTIINDSIADKDETVNLTLINPDDATLGTPDTATLTIVDDEKALYLPLILRD